MRYPFRTSFLKTWCHIGDIREFCYILFWINPMVFSHWIEMKYLNYIFSKLLPARCEKEKCSKERHCSHYDKQHSAIGQEYLHFTLMPICLWEESTARGKICVQEHYVNGGTSTSHHFYQPTAYLLLEAPVLAVYSLYGPLTPVFMDGT